MCAPPPTPKKPKPPPPVEAPEIELGDRRRPLDVRRRQQRGRSALRSGLNIPASGGGGSGLSIPGA